MRLTRTGEGKLEINADVTMKKLSIAKGKLMINGVSLERYIQNTIAQMIAEKGVSVGWMGPVLLGCINRVRVRVTGQSSPRASFFHAWSEPGHDNGLGTSRNVFLHNVSSKPAFHHPHA